jgi:hypothetical protein
MIYGWLGQGLGRICKMKAEIIAPRKGTFNAATRIRDRMLATFRFLRGWITAPSVPRPASEAERLNDPRRPELKNIPPAGLGGSM